MRKLVITLFLLFSIFFYTNGLSGDLYLLKIDSYNSLDKVSNIVHSAKGRIGGKFIVELNKDQIDLLTAYGISLRLVEENIKIDNFYFLGKISPAAPRTAVTFDAKISINGNYIVEMDRKTIDVLRKEGFMAIAIKDLNTPLFYNPPVFSPQFRDIYPSDSIADFVIQDSLYFYDTRLEAFQTRLIYTDSIHSARDWLASQFAGFGYTNVTTDLFYDYGTACYNVKCIKPGTTEADALIVIGGHYDSINFENDGSGMTYAPGADDNASGTSVVVELARIFQNIETKKSIMFIAFSAEEVGLVGAYHEAANLYYDPYYDVEVMFNFDMVAYNENTNNMVQVTYMDLSAYGDALYNAFTRVTNLTPAYSQGGSSDHRAFDAYGFQVAYASEGIFNWEGWHTNLDISSRLDFTYLEQIARSAAATVGLVDRAATQSPIEDILDIGDGQSIRVIWGNCDATYTYQLLYGTSSQNYTDTIDILSVPPCYYDVDGLIEGQEYFFTIIPVNSEGYGPVALHEGSGMTLVYPRIPSGLTAAPGLNVIELSWFPNPELDLNHYRLYRREIDSEWSVLEDNVVDTIYSDLTAQAHTEYEYMIKAIDDDQNESDGSSPVSGIMATFDIPLLFVDETFAAGVINPSEAEQAALYDSILFKNINYRKFIADVPDSVLSRSLSGQFASIIWLDDDLTTQLFGISTDTVSWFLNYNTNFCLAGWQTISWLTGEGSLPPGHFIRDNFGINQVNENVGFDFIGAIGQNGWPNLQSSTDNIFSGLLPNISKFGALAGVEVIYTFDSNTDDPEFEGEPCAVLYDTGSGKRIALGFPVYHLTEESAIALTLKILETFDIEQTFLNGDANNNGSLNILDITFLINYLYKDGLPPPVLNLADANGDCSLSLLDITYLISYLYKGGPEPLEGCVE